MQTLASPYRALVVGASGGIGSALVAELRRDPACGEVIELSRADGLDLTREATIERAIGRLGSPSLDLVIVATGMLVDGDHLPEKTIRAIEPEAMARQFAVNAIGPALLLKHLAPLLARDRRAIFATLSARVGSITDNRLGGWISYRAAKAALNQIVHTAAIEIARGRPEAVLVALHPGTVATRLSEPYAANRERLEPDESATRLLGVLDTLSPAQTGGFFAYDGKPIAW